MPACFTFQSYNDVAEDMRGDEDTKAELHQQLDVRNTNTYSLFRYSVRYYIELLPGKNSCKRIFVVWPVPTLFKSRMLRANAHKK